MTISDKTVSQEKLNDFMLKVASDFGAAWSTVLINIGDKLGLYKEMSKSGPITSQELANRTGTVERYIREWLANQAGRIRHLRLEHKEVHFTSGTRTCSF